jgi:hypothetical protein
MATVFAAPRFANFALFAVSFERSYTSSSLRTDVCSPAAGGQSVDVTKGLEAMADALHERKMASCLQMCFA